MADSYERRPEYRTREQSNRRRQLRKRLRAYREGRPRRRIPRAAVPSFFTLMNLFSGFLSITQTYAGRYDYACWLIVLAGFFDVLDGMMARLTNGQSLFGVELDSLSDVVSFGVAPSFLVFGFALKEFGELGLIVSALPAVCGAVRLARFNVSFTGEKEDYFSGLPIPMGAVAIVAVILNVNDAGQFSRFSLNNLSLLIPYVVVVAGLMVSTIKFDAVPKPSAAYIRQHPRKAIAFFVALLLLVFLQQIGLLIVVVAYLLYGIVRAVHELVQEVMQTPLDGETPS